MRSPRNVKEVQRLADRIASLARFLPCMAERSRPIISLLKKARKFQWTEECESSFQDFKKRLAAPPLLAKPNPLLEMIVYISASDKAISTALVQEQTEQIPVYFISRVLQEAETRYQHLEKTVLALVHTARRLRHYFQGHKVVVRTDSPIVKVLWKPELAGRMVSWSVELSQFDIRFEPRGPIKAQSMADFINEFTPEALPEPHVWTLHVDGSSNLQGSGAGIILEGPGKVVIEQSLRFDFKTSNNQAEYEALLAGLRLASDLGIAEEVHVEHTPRELNVRADQLARLASSKKTSHLRSMIQQELQRPSITQEECLHVQQDATDWMTSIIQYLLEGTLPTDPLEAKKVRTRVARYVMIAGELYKRSVSAPLLKCLTPEQAHYVLREIHEGVCGTHSGSRTLAAKVIRAGYYWPTLTADCAKFVQHCRQCQQHGPLTHQPPEELHSITTPWPFSIWGMDILGPFPSGKGQAKFLVVAVDHFTKWIEAEALTTITANNVQKFFWKNIVTRFGIPYALITDEAANKVILRELKRRLGEAKGSWPDHLPDILWAYRCTPQSSTKETHFRLTYGTDAMIPVEVGEPSLRRTQFDEDANGQPLNIELDLIDEARDRALINMEACRTRLARKLRTKLKPREFQAGDLV
ncbi:uncharacterized protein LOC109801971 [Cajanus cajan]|uniref:uncharacterized protein LOC109801971 n=1 Tax=Cajanus cajan TaxID=3821 RepID=UPI00098D7C76|nr:uncharacterized protein LOC109801971 [Cajanus cajan]